MGGQCVLDSGWPADAVSPGVQDIWMVGDLMRYGVEVTAAAEEEQSS
jgi:cell division protease FtsH